MNGKHLSHGFIFLISIFLIFSCSNDNSFEQKIETIDGVKTVINSAIPMNPLVEKFELVEELSIGVDEGDSNYVFGHPSVVGIDRQKNIYIYDYSFHRISKFDSTGNFLLSFGKKGQGPGEFKSASIIIDRNSNIILSDPVNRRISVFDSIGGLVDDFLIQGRDRAIFLNSKNQIILLNSETNFVTKIHTYFITSYSFTGEVIDSLIRVEQNIFAVVNGGARGSIGIHPFHCCIDEHDSFYIIFDSRYKINKYNSQGELMFQFNRRFKSVELTEEEKESRKKPVLGLNNKKYHAPIPKYKWDIYKVFSVNTKELWIYTARKDGEFRLFDVFDKNGKYLRKFYLKTSLPWYRVNFYQEKLFAVVETEEGFLRVKKFRLEKID